MLPDQQQRQTQAQIFDITNIAYQNFINSLKFSKDKNHLLGCAEKLSYR